MLHEANARPGLANRLGARYTPFVGVAFEGTPLPHATFVGMPLRVEIEELDRAAARPEAAAELRPRRRPPDPARHRRLARRAPASTDTIADARRASSIAAGWQVLHIQGGRGELTDPGIDGYRLLDYCDRMDLALAIADFAVARAGAATVSEFAALGIPAVYVPYPVGNGEQRFNAAGVVGAGGGLLVDDAAFHPGVGAMRRSCRCSPTAPRVDDDGRPRGVRRRPRRLATAWSSLIRSALGDPDDRRVAVILDGDLHAAEPKAAPVTIKPDLSIDPPRRARHAALRRHRRLRDERHRPPVPRGRLHGDRLRRARLGERRTRCATSARPIAIGHDAANVGDADTLVVTGALWQDNPEYQLALREGPAGAAPLAGARLADQPASASSRSPARTARPPRPA